METNNVLAKTFCKMTGMENHGDIPAGIFLCPDIPTGYGKSHACAEIIRYGYSKRLVTSSRKAFFCSATKENVMDVYDKIIKREGAYPCVPESEVLYLKSTIDTAKDMAKSISEDRGRIFFEVPNGEKKEFPSLGNEEAREKLLSAISDVKKNAKILDANKSMDAGYKAYLENEIGERYREAYGILLDCVSGTKSTLTQCVRDFVERNEDVLRVSFPAVLIDRYPVVLCTHARYFRQVSTFFDRQNGIYALKCAKNSFLLLDESDKAKNTIRDIILEKFTAVSPDAVNMFCQMTMYRDIMYTKFSKYMDEDSKEPVEEFFEKGDELDRKYRITSANFKMPDFESRRKSRFLFLPENDRISVSDKEKNIYLVYKHPNEESNIVFFAKQDVLRRYEEMMMACLEGEGTEGTDVVIPVGNGEILEVVLTPENSYFLVDMMVDLAGFTNRFFRIVRKMCGTYLKTVECSMEHAISTVLSTFFGEKSIYKDFFENNLYEKEYFAEDRLVKNRFLGSSYWTHGFCYFELEQNLKHNENLYIRQSIVAGNPETVLANLCRKQRVLCFSATANIDTSISNFCWEEVAQIAGAGKFLFLEEEEKEELRLWRENQRDWSGVRFSADIAPFVENHAGKEKNKVWDSFVSEMKNLVPEGRSEDILNEVISRIGGLAGKKTDRGEEAENASYDDFALNLYLQAAFTIRKMQDSMVNSCLFFDNGYWTDASESRLRDKSIVNKIRNVLYGEDEASDHHLEILFTNEWKERGDESDKNRYVEAILKTAGEMVAKGKQVLIFTVYQALGVGANLAIAVQDGTCIWETESLAGEERRVQNWTEPHMELSSCGRKDFQMVSLVAPTHVFPLIDRDDFSMSFLRAVENLYRLKAVEEIDEDTWMEFIQNFMESKKPSFKKEMRYKPSYNGAILSVLLQAIGRIDRTPWKDRELFVVADRGSSIALANAYDNAEDALESSVLQKTIAKMLSETYEMRSLAKDRNPFSIVSCEEYERKRGNNEDGLFYRNPETQELVREEEVLLWYESTRKNPTPDSENEEHMLPQSYLRKSDFEICDKYYYAAKEDHSYRISREKIFPYDCEVSEKGAKLDVAKKIAREILKEQENPEAFDEKFPAWNLDSMYIMSPEHFVHYKGRVGEAIAELILNAYYGIQTAPLPRKTEFFDAVLEGRPDILFDFKNYEVPAPWRKIRKKEYENREKTMSKIKEKAVEYGGVTAIFVVNPIQCITTNENIEAYKKCHVSRFCDEDFAIYEVPFLLQVRTNDDGSLQRYRDGGLKVTANQEFKKRLEEF